METRECASLQQPRWRARLACWRSRPAIGDFSKNFFGETPKPARETRALRGNAIKKNSERFFCTSNPPVSRGELAAEPFAPLSFFFLRRSFFAVRPGLADSGIGLQRTRTQKLKSGFSVTLANEADRFEYSGSWLAARRSFGLIFFPPSPLFGTRAFCLRAKRTLCPLSCFSGVGTPLGAQTTSVFHSQTIGLWEIVSSYSSATAPASHRISRADPLFQTRKELSEQ